MNFKELIKEYTQKQPEPGDVIEAEILRVTEKDILLDVGSKRDAIASADELDDERRDKLSEGDQVLLVITDVPSGEGHLKGSIRKGLEKEDWIKAQGYLETEEVLELEVHDYNQGGLLVQFGPLEGFVPNSHIYEFRDHDSLNERKEAMIGRVIGLQFIEVDQAEERLVLSNRNAFQELRARRLMELRIGDVETGRVVNIVDFGAFVDLGGIDGLIHRSELSWEYVESASELLAIGEEIEVYIKDVDVERERVGLSLKALQPGPWDTIEDRFQTGDLVEGTVVNVRDFGVFVNIGSGIVGLIHISETERGPSGAPTAYYQKGDRILTKIIHIDPLRQRIGLSQRQATTRSHLTDGGIEAGGARNGQNSLPDSL